jgi:hypothetical protein
MSNLCIYCWKDLDGYLLERLLSLIDFRLITAIEHDDHHRILDEVGTSCDSFLFHLDCTFDATILPEESRRSLLAELTSRGVEVLNGAASDISKYRVHAHTRSVGLPSVNVAREGDDDELLIVKTDLNSGGYPERILQGKPRNPIIGGPECYVVLPRQDVEVTWWTDQSLSIERFVVNPDNLFYRVTVLGSRYAISEGRSSNLIKRMDGHCPQQDRRISQAELTDLDPNLHGLWVGVAKTAVVFSRSFGLD